MQRWSRYLLVLSVSLFAPAFANAQMCDVDGDNDVDRFDIGLVAAARGQLATGPDDPRDPDGDGYITINDVRQCMFLCNLPRCAEVTQNNAPIADAGPDQTVFVGETVTLDGSGSTDADGDALTYAWTQVSVPPGSAAALSDPSAVMPTFVADVPGEYVFELVVDDGQDTSGPDLVVVTTANSPPVADAGPDQGAFIGDTVMLDGSGSFDVDGDPLAFFWTISFAPAGSAASLSDPTAVMPTFVPDVAGDYVIELVVDDGLAASLPDSVAVSTLNSPPVADAGPDQTAFVGDTVMLDGSGSFDVDGDALTFSWSLITRPAGSAAVLAGPDTVAPTFTVDLPGTYVAQLVVNDGAVDSGPDNVVVVTTNSRPVADAGPDQAATVGDTVTLDGSGSFDADGDTLTYSWSLLVVPAGSSAFLSDPTAVNPTFDADVEGDFIAQLIVNDGSLDSDPDSMIVVVSVAPNTAPVLGAIGNQSVDEGALLTFTATAADTDVPANVLTFSLDAGAPIGASIDPTTGVFNWTPTEAQGPGDHPVTVRVSDDGTPPLDDSETLSIEVREVNEAPVLAAIGDQVVNEGETLSFTASATDPDLPANTLTFSLDAGAPAGAGIDPSSGGFSWTPTEAQGPGDFSITIRVTDDGAPSLEDSETITVTVNEVNEAPVLATISNQAVEQEQLLTFTATATDPDIPANTLTFSLGAGAPTGASIDPVTGVFTWTPTTDQGPAEFPVTIIVTDDGSPPLSDSQSIIIAVSEEPNVAPELAAIGAQTIEELAELNLTATATDANTSDILTFSLDVGAPAGASIDAVSGLFSWTPTEAQGPGDYTVTIIVTDDGSPNLSDSQAVSITVDEVNEAPVLAAIGNQTVDEGDILSFTASATDDDIPANTLTFSLDAGAPAGATIDPATGLFEWTATEDDGGNNVSVTVRVTDDGTPALDDSETITITVNEVNQAPVLDPIGDQAIDELAELSFTATASDPDVPADTLTFSLDAGAPAGATIDPTTGLFSWTPTEAQGPGDYTVTIRVTDDGTPSLDDSETITITVNEVNQAPVLAAIGNRAVDELSALTFTASASDDDLPANTLTFSLDAGAPAGATIDPTTGVFDWTPTEAQGPGDFTITVRVTDDATPALDDSETVTVTVAEVNEAPVLDPIGDQAIDELVELSFTAVANDPDLPANALTFSLDAGAPADATIDPVTGVFSWTPTEADGGNDFTVTVRVTDDGTPALDDSETITITVNEANSLPEAVDDTATTDEDTPVDIDVLANDSDPDGDTLTISNVTQGSNGSVTNNGTDVTYTPDADFEGTDQFSYTIDDGNGETDSATVTVTINPVNDAPVANDDSAETDEDVPVTIDVLANDTDVDTGDTLTIQSVTTPTNGTAVINAGQVDYTPDAEFSGTDTFTYTITDGTDTDSATVTVTVNEVNDAPIANAGPDQNVILTDTVQLDGSGSSDPDGDTITYLWSALSGPPGSTVTFSDETAQSPTAEFDLVGTYVLQLEVSDASQSGTDTVTITVGPAPSVSISNAGVAEGDSGTADLVFNVSISAPIDRVVTVDYATADGTATTADNDYVADTGTVTFPANTSGAQQITITVNGDTDIEPNETMFVNLSNPVNATIADAQGLGQINNDDAAATITLTPTTLNLATGDVGTFTVTLNQIAPAGGTIVTLASANTAIVTVPAQVTVPEGDTTVTFDATAGATSGSTSVTASAAGFTSDSSTVVVSDRALSVTLDSPLVGVGRTVGGIVTLAQPAAPGGVTVTLASGNDAVATVAPLSVFIAAGDTQAAFTVTGVSAGTVPISASAPGYATAQAEITVTSSLISFGTVPVIAPEQSASLPISLSTPAPPGGVTVTLTMSDPNIASVTPSIFIPEGAQVPAANPQVTGILIGTVQVTGTAPGFAPDTRDVIVTLNIAFAPDPFAVVESTTDNITLDLSAPAPSGGITIALSTDDTGVATVPPNVVVPQGQTSTQVPVTGQAPGQTILRANSAGIAEATATINVSTAPPITATDRTLGDDLQTSTFAALGQQAPPGNVVVTITSNDPGRLLVSPDSTTPGSPSFQRTVNAGQTSVGNIWLQALDDTGTVDVTMSAPGYSTGTFTVTFVPSGFIWLTNSFNTTTFSAESNVSIRVGSLNTTTLNFAQELPLRAGLTVDVPVMSSNTAVGTIVSPITMTGSNSRASTTFDPDNAGTTDLTIGQPAGFQVPASGTQVITATVSAPDINLSNVTVGQDLQVSRTSSLAVAPPSPVDVTYTVANPGIAAISTDENALGGGQITRLGIAGTGLGTIYVQGLSVGSTTITVQAAGYNDRVATVDVVPSGFTLLSNDFTTTTFSANSNVTIRSVRLNPTTFTIGQEQTVRGGLTVNIPVTSSDTNVGTIGSPFSVAATESRDTVEFDPANPGTTDLAFTQPAGFTSPAGGRETIVATVTAPAITFADTLVGRNLQVARSTNLGEAPPAPVNVTYSIGNTGIAIISDTANAVGSGSYVRTNVSNALPGNIYVQGLTEGTTTLTISAPGFTTRVATIEVVPAGFEILTNSFTTNTFAPDVNVSMRSVRLNPANNNIAAEQPIRGGTSFDVTMMSSDTNVGTITSPYTFDCVAPCTTPPSRVTGQFDPQIAGTTDLTMTQPAGFTTPANGDETITATVDAPNINIAAAARVGDDLQILVRVSLGATPPAATDVVVTVASGTIATISDDASLEGSTTVTFSGVTNTVSRDIYVQGQSLGDTVITVQAAGYNDATSNVSVEPSGFVFWNPLSITTEALSANTTVTIGAARLDPTTLNYSALQYVRGGLTVNVDITSTNPAVGVMVPSTISFGPNASTITTAFDPDSDGVTSLEVQAPAGFDAPSNRNPITATVTNDFIVPAGEQNLSLLPGVTASSSSILSAAYQPEEVVDGIDETSNAWCAANTDPTGTLTIDLGASSTISNIGVRNPWSPNFAVTTGRFELYALGDTPGVSTPIFNSGTLTLPGGEIDYTLPSAQSGVGIVHMVTESTDNYPCVGEFGVIGTQP